MLSPAICEVCDHSENLRRCSGCLAVSYCGRDHQVQHRPSHKGMCQPVKALFDNLNREEKALREHPGDGATAPNPFETAAGHFWTVRATRPYMQARYGLAQGLLRSFAGFHGRVAAVEEVLRHLLDMLSLCRGDNMAVRFIVPSLYIRLGRDQEAYDFVKWYATVGWQGGYDWHNMDLPFLNLKDADVLEAPDVWTSIEKWLDPCHASCVALIKVRILADLQAIRLTIHKAPAGTDPQEVINAVRDNLANPILKSRREILDAGLEGIAETMETLVKQLREIYRAVEKSNPHFWPAMLDDPSYAIMNPPLGYTPGSKEEAFYMVNHNLFVWYESQHAMGIMKMMGREE